MTSLSEMGGYEVQHGLLDTKEHGIPRSRSRVYIVGIRSDVYDQSQLFPTPIARPSLEFFLEKRDARKAREVPPAKQTTARANVEQALESIRLAGEDPLKKPYVIDCDSSGSRADRMFGVSPCITCRRGGGHWVTNRGRRFSKEEMMRLQGMNPARFKVAVSAAQLGRQLGNAMSVNVLERLLALVLPAAGLTASRAPLPDRRRQG